MCWAPCLSCTGFTGGKIRTKFPTFLLYHLLTSTCNCFHPSPYLLRVSTLHPLPFPIREETVPPGSVAFNFSSHWHESLAFSAHTSGCHLSGLLHAQTRWPRGNDWSCLISANQDGFTQQSEHGFCPASTVFNKMEPLFKYLEILQERVWVPKWGNR